MKAWMFWGGLALAFGVWLAYKYLWPVLRSRGWQRIPARVVDVTVSEWDSLPNAVNPSGALYKLQVSYSYEVNGEFYSGYYSPPVLDETDIANYRQSYPKGRPIMVRCNRSRPEDSVLVERDQQNEAPQPTA